MTLFSAPKLTREESSVIDRIFGMRAQLRFSKTAPLRWYGMLRRSSLARAIRGSNSIEGYSVSKDDALAAVEGEEPLDAESEAWHAVMGYRNAMTYVLQLSQDPDFKFDDGYIRSLHFMMLNYDLTKHPGNWRPGPIYVRDDQKNEVVYEGPDREFIDPLMRELMQELNASCSGSECPDIVRAAMAHLNFVMIHTFSDGNGSMARCLQTMVLSRQGILEPQFCSVEEYLGRYTQAYYEVLAEVGQGSWHPENDTRPWIRFMLKAHYQQAAVLLYRMKLIQRIWEEAELIVTQYGLPQRLTIPLVDASLGFRVRNAIYRKQEEISENLASRDLKLAVDAKLLVAEGEGRGRYYRAAPILKDLRVRLGERFNPGDPFAEKGTGYLPGMEPRPSPSLP